LVKYHRIDAVKVDQKRGSIYAASFFISIIEKNYMAESGNEV